MKISSSLVKPPLVMGILNVTPDSFSDGSQFLDPDLAIEHGLKMIRQGAKIIDLGGESTRPGAIPVPAATELQRVIPVLKQLKKQHPELLFSIDTRKAEVAKAAITCGADIINDISALRYDKAMAGVIAANPRVRLILMHMQGEPQNMQDNPHYIDVVQELGDFFEERITYCIRSGISRENLMLDPGIGFGKSLEHNLMLLSSLDSYSCFGLPLVLGASRKSFIAKITPGTPESRLEGSLAAAAIAMLQGIDIIRVHDVQAHENFIKVFQAICQAGGGVEWVS